MVIACEFIYQEYKSSSIEIRTSSVRLSLSCAPADKLSTYVQIFEYGSLRPSCLEQTTLPASLQTVEYERKSMLLCRFFAEQKPVEVILARTEGHKGARESLLTETLGHSMKLV